MKSTINAQSDTVQRFKGCRANHPWAWDWLKKHNWRAEAWAIYALRTQYNGRHDGETKMPVRVRALAEDVWADLQAGLITSTTTLLDYEASTSY